MEEKAKCKNCTNEKELIEEMVKEICKVCYERHGTGTRLCEVYERKDCYAYDSAEILYNAGYRKPLEGSVVLTKEEYEALHKDINDYKQRYQSSEKRYEQLVQSSCEAITKSRKETAKEILKALTTVIRNNTKYGNNFVVLYLKDLQELARHYGVEVEE